MKHLSEIIQDQQKPEPAKSAPTLVEASEILNIVTAVGKEMNPGFMINAEQEFYYIDLFNYFRGADGRLDLNKGLLICGPVGTGKTFSMRLFQKMTRAFGIVTTRHIIRDYFAEKVPSTIIDKYGRESFYKSSMGVIDKKKPQTWCFDDFGLESVSVKNYGNEQNILEEIMLDRYDLALSCGMKTIVTTNLTPEMIEQNYGLRVRDRFRETMNYLTLTGETFRK